MGLTDGLDDSVLGPLKDELIVCVMARSSASVFTSNSSAPWAGRTAPGPRPMSHATIAGLGTDRRRQVDSGHSAGRSSSLASGVVGDRSDHDPKDTDTGGSWLFSARPESLHRARHGPTRRSKLAGEMPAVVRRRPGGAASRAVGESGLVRKLPGTAVLRRGEVVGVPAKGGWWVLRWPRGMEAG